MDRNYENWEAPSSLPDSKAELRRIRRDIQRRSRKNIIISLLLAAALLIGTVHYGIPALENLYWHPETVSYGTANATDLDMTFYAYGKLFYPDKMLADVSAVRTGFASYSLTIDNWALHQNDHSYTYATLEKGVLTLPKEFWNEPGQVNVGKTRKKTQEQDLTMLSQLPEYIRVGCYVTFREDLTMEEALAWRDTVRGDIQIRQSDCQVQWLAVRHQEDAYAYPCGLSMTQSEGFWDEVNDVYPCFSNVHTAYVDTANSTGTAPDGSAKSWAPFYETQFLSVLRYLNDQYQKGEGIEIPNYPDYYDSALTYVEENGINIYGCYVVASPQRLLEINEQKNVQYLWPVDAWINI